MKTFLLCTLTLLISIPNIAWAASPIGTIITLEGRATLQSESSDTITELKENTSIHLGDTIETYEASKILVLFADNTQITLGEDSNLHIDEYVFNPQSAQKNKGRFSVLKGVFLLTSGLISKNDNPDVEINTNVGSIGLRGTIVWGGPLNNQYGVLVQVGEVDVKNEHGQVTLYNGEGSFIKDAQTRPRKIGGWDNTLVSRALRTVRLENTKEVQEKLSQQKEKNSKAFKTP